MLIKITIAVVGKKHLAGIIKAFEDYQIGGIKLTIKRVPQEQSQEPIVNNKSLFKI